MMMSDDRSRLELAMSERALCRPDLPERADGHVARGPVVSARSLAELTPGVTFSRLPRLAERGWTWFNPSVAVAGDEVHLLVRSSNYTIQPSGYYSVFDRNSVIRTRYARLRLDAGLELRELAPIVDRTDPEGRSAFPVSGYEDCRLIRQGDQWLATATARDRNADGICQQVLLRLDSDTWSDCRPVSVPEDGHQKNWMPFVAGGSLLAVQRCHPLTVARIDPDTGEGQPVVEHHTTPLATAFRGGSQGVAVDDGWLFVVHEAVPRGDRRRVYLHRLIRLDGHFRLTHITRQFFFSRKGIEFCAGMARLGDDLLLSFGVHDEEAWIARLPLRDALALLRPVETFDGAPGEAPVPPAFPREARPRAGIVSVTLAGPGTEGLIADALRSVVDQVDRCLVIDTGIGQEGIAAARQIAGSRLLVRHLDWPDDFAAARNAALRMAAETGAAWAVTIDTDERLRLGPIDLRASLAETRDDVLSLRHATAGYTKPRVFRLPARGLWVGQTHEFFDTPPAAQATLSDCAFDEVPKPEPVLRRKLERDRDVLQGMIASQPHEARWWYYLGATLSRLGDTPAAIVAFDRCASLDGWAEEAAWARYREATCWLALGDQAEAVRACAEGLARHPGVAELAWLAGYASWQAGDDEDAVRWSNLALAHGAGSEAHAGRIGFRNPMALHEGPYDVLRYALRALGRGDEADEAERRFAAARRRRLGMPETADRDGAGDRDERAGGRNTDMNVAIPTPQPDMVSAGRDRDTGKTRKGTSWTAHHSTD